MSLIPWKREETVANRFEQMQREMNRLFGDFFGGSPLVSSSWFPPLTTSETDKHVIVRAEVPGIAAQDLDVSIKNDLLTIKGEKRAEKKEEKESYYCVERSFGGFMRQIALPSDVDPNAVESRLSDGVLELRLPKRAERAGNGKIKIDVK